MKLTFGNGTVTLLPPAEAIPRHQSSTASGVIVNVLNAEPRPARPVRFGVAFTITTPSEDPHLQPGKIFVDLAVPVPSGSVHQEATYSQIELAAARRLPAWLRDVADAVESELARTKPEDDPSD